MIHILETFVLTIVKTDVIERSRSFQNRRSVRYGIIRTGSDSDEETVFERQIAHKYAIESSSAGRKAAARSWNSEITIVECITAVDRIAVKSRSTTDE